MESLNISLFYKGKNQKKILQIGMWLGVTLRTDVKKMCLEMIGLCVQNMIIVLNSIVNITGITYMTS